MIRTQVSRIAHAAIASLCVQCLRYPNAGRCTLTAMSVPPGILTKVVPSVPPPSILTMPLLYLLRRGREQLGTAIILTMPLFYLLRRYSTY